MEFCYKFYGSIEFQIILFGLLLSFSVLNEAQFNCDYSQDVKPGETYWVFNPEYPDFTREHYCTWEIKSVSDVEINCNVEFQHQQKFQCQQKLSIQFATGGKFDYNCDNLPPLFNVSLTGRSPILKWMSEQDLQGRFLCQIKTLDYCNNYDYCKCGQKKTTRIVGGEESEVNEYPMMGGLVNVDEKMIYCGCTIISPKYMLTAAHCVDNRNITRIGVIVGEHDTATGSDTNATKLYPLMRCDIHPGYKNEKYAHNDVAICRIKVTIKYSAEVGPVCLPFQHKNDSFGGSILTALGWGLLEFGGKKPKALHKVDLNVISLKQCKHYYPAVTDSNVCTFTPKKDTCQMDSGGPLLWQNPTTHNLVLVGIISSGVGCASKNPAVSMLVGAYINWIVSVTPDEQYCQVE